MPEHFYPFSETGTQAPDLFLYAAESIAKDLKIRTYVGCKLMTEFRRTGLIVSSSSHYVNEFGAFQTRLSHELGRPLRLWGHSYNLEGFQDMTNQENLVRKIREFLEKTRSFKDQKDFIIDSYEIRFMRRSHLEIFLDDVRAQNIGLPKIRPSRSNTTCQVISLDAFRLRRLNLA